MNFNSLFFPAPKPPSYTYLTFMNELLYVPKTTPRNSEVVYMPCLFIRYVPKRNG